jgi:pSer/pThr/pTyr-binding forkhead associated (FHA) protein
VRTPTPLATPVVPAPQLQTRTTHTLRELSAPLLVPPVTVVGPTGDFELERGSLLVGRLPECNILLGDELVSRMHARISVQEDCVQVEDLHSTNGVYVNGMRVTNTFALRQGARILIGTTELSLFEIRDSSVMKVYGERMATSPYVSAAPGSMQPPVGPLSRGPEERPRPSPADRSDDRSRLVLKLKQGEESRRPTSPPPVAERIPSTARASALKMIGALAERLAVSGELDEAVYVLSGQLRRVLQGANTGLVVPPDVMTLASHYALLLSQWSGESVWIDYVVELHLSASALMDPVTLMVFEGVVSKTASYDKLLLTYYVDALRKQRAHFSVEERGRVERLALFTGRG